MINDSIILRADGCSSLTYLSPIYVFRFGPKIRDKSVDMHWFRFIEIIEDGVVVL